jgi:hypothetical protein
MVTTGIDKTVRVWDVENQAASFVYDALTEQPSCISWSPNGNLLALNEKKGKLSVVDVRTNNGAGALSTISHPGPKAQSNCWASDNNIISVGFNKDASRKYCIWDIRYFTEALCRNDLGNGNSVQRLTYDHEHDLIYAFGRGSSEITLWKYNAANPDGLLNLNNYVESAPTIGFSLMPKHVLNPMKHEVNRGVRLTNNKEFQFVSFTAENKTGLFQQHLYPPMLSDEQTCTVEDWVSGKEIIPVMKQLTEADAPKDNTPKVKLGGGGAKEIADLKKVVEEKDARIAELEANLATVTAELAACKAAQE